MMRYPPVRPAVVSALALAALSLLPLAAHADALPPGLERAEILSGPPQPDGSRLVALHLDLTPGWKTYWRSPGETGVAPVFDWTAAQNLGGAEPLWPRPEIIESDGTTALGFHDALVLPIRLTPAADGAPVAGQVAVDLGLCLNICVPAHVRLALPPVDAPADPRVQAALALAPDQGAEPVTCTVTEIADGMRVTAALTAPEATRDAAAMELVPGEAWVSQPEIAEANGKLTATADFVGPTGKPFALDPGAVRLTLVGAGGAVEYQGCAAS